MRATLSVQPKCSHRCVSLKGAPLKPVQILKHATQNSTKQTVMRTKWFKHIVIQTLQAHLLSKDVGRGCCGQCRGFRMWLLSQEISQLVSSIQERQKKRPSSAPPGGRSFIEEQQQGLTESCKKGKGHQNRAPSLLEPRVFF